MRPNPKGIAYYEGDDLVIRLVDFKYDLMTDGKAITRYLKKSLSLLCGQF